MLIIIPILLFAEKDEPKPEPKPSGCCVDKEEQSATRHEVVINGQKIAYQAIAGNYLLKDDKCQPKASIFFISYTKEEKEPNVKRPVTFCFNGGPGSSSVWLHLGALGPKRVKLTENGDALPPYTLIDNEYSILDATDLVFIDPVSTGYSCAIPIEDAKKYHNFDEDVKSFAEFMRLYVTRNQRWDSPKFICGESYGTTRAAALAGYLHDQSYMYVNGIIMVSSVINFQAVDFAAGNDLPYVLALPSYTAAAWYHKKLPTDLQNSFEKALQEARAYASDGYSLALFKGDQLSKDEKNQTAQKLSRLMGISQSYIEQSNLRVNVPHFNQELLRDQQRMVGRYDARYKGIDTNVISEIFDYDPTIEAILGAFTATMNQYLASDLKLNKDINYKILNTHVFPWDYGNTNQYVNVSETLRNVITKNSYFTIFVANGYFDLATPFFATDYTFNHLGLEPSLIKNITMQYYDAGHMMYLHLPSLKKLKKDLADYYVNTLKFQSVD